MPAGDLRIIAFDRPGYGLSDPAPPGATWEHLARDVGALASHLGLARFPIVGVSGGGPVAAACAHFMPDRIAALALVCAVPPPGFADGGGLGLLMRLGRAPALGRPALWVARRLIASDAWADRIVFGTLLEGRDGVVMTADRRALLLAAMREGLCRGTEGAMADARRYGHPWGFRLEDIAVPTTIWQGDADPLIPWQTSRAFSAIPRARLRLEVGEGHYSLAIGRAQMILSALFAQAGSRLD